MAAARRLALVAAGVAGAALWWRKHPSACPYSQRFWVQAPHPFITRERLREILAPQPGERLLEVGPGTGFYTLPVAEWLGPGGSLDVVDVQREMLDHTLGRAREAALGNITPTLADARELPFADDGFDGAFLVTVLGEVPDQDAALRELRRVVRPGGRIVVGELFGDPHMVTHAALARRAEAAGLRVERKLGGRLWHFTRLQAGLRFGAVPSDAAPSMTRAMLYAVLICTDESCAEEFEAWGELDDFDAMLCEGCGCALQPLAFSEVSLSTIVAFPRRTPHVQLRNAA